MHLYKLNILIMYINYKNSGQEAAIAPSPSFKSATANAVQIIPPLPDDSPDLGICNKIVYKTRVLYL